MKLIAFFGFAFLILNASTAKAATPGWVYAAFGLNSPCQRNLPLIRPICEGIESAYQGLRDLHEDPKRLQLQYLMQFVVIPKAQGLLARPGLQPEDLANLFDFLSGIAAGDSLRYLPDLLNQTEDLTESAFKRLIPFVVQYPALLPFPHLIESEYDSISQGFLSASTQERIRFLEYALSVHPHDPTVVRLLNDYLEWLMRDLSRSEPEIISFLNEAYPRDWRGEPPALVGLFWSKVMSGESGLQQIKRLALKLGGQAKFPIQERFFIEFSKDITDPRLLDFCFGENGLQKPGVVSLASDVLLDEFESGRISFLKKDSSPRSQLLKKLVKTRTRSAESFPLIGITVWRYWIQQAPNEASGFRIAFYLDEFVPYLNSKVWQLGQKASLIEARDRELILAMKRNDLASMLVMPFEGVITGFVEEFPPAIRHYWKEISEVFFSDPKHVEARWALLLGEQWFRTAEERATDSRYGEIVRRVIQGSIEPARNYPMLARALSDGVFLRVAKQFSAELTRWFIQNASHFSSLMSEPERVNLLNAVLDVSHLQLTESRSATVTAARELVGSLSLGASRLLIEQRIDALEQEVTTHLMQTSGQTQAAREDRALRKKICDEMATRPELWQ